MKSLSPSDLETQRDQAQLLFNNITLPLFSIKSDDGKRFDFTNEEFFIAPSVKKKYDLHKDEIKKNKKVMILKEMPYVPDIKFTLSIDCDFSIFINEHKKIENKLREMILDVIENQTDMVSSFIAYCINRVDSLLFYNALSTAFTQSKYVEFRHIRGDAVSIFPTLFFNSSELDRFKLRSKLDGDSFEIPPTGTNVDEEYRVAYFREDVALNAHHAIWHLVYKSDKEYHTKFRRGELFYYMHQQMVARYNCERLCNMLPRTKSFRDFKMPIPEGYYPKMRSIRSSKNWAGRPANLRWRDIYRPYIVTSVNDVVSQMMRVEQAIDEGRVVVDANYLDMMKKENEGKKRNRINLDLEISKPDKNGIFCVPYKTLDIDILGHMIESTKSSPNFPLYKDMHAQGHIFTAFIHDPKNKYQEKAGVMGATETAVRDPMFFRWHSLIDDIFVKFKTSRLCPAYSYEKLSYDGISVESVELKYDTESNPVFETFWSKTEIVINGLDFMTEKVAQRAEFKHLNHTPFTYVIKVKNNTQKEKKGTVRIFLAPKFDENNVRLELSAQRRLFLEMDRFVCKFDPEDNEVEQTSKESSIIIPIEQSFPLTFGTIADNYCKCGWPHHLLVPKGTVKGAEYQLFVMVSNFEDDDVNKEETSEKETSEKETSDKETSEKKTSEEVTSKKTVYKYSSSFCGLKDKVYPDARDMGFPFDRSMKPKYIEDFVAKHSNMICVDVTIKHFDEVRPNPNLKSSEE